jgi:hypothetical protein
MAIQEFLKNSRKPSRKVLTPGTYTSTVTNVTIDDQYKDTALIVSYCLQKNNSVFEYKERFIRNSRFPRTVNFYEYLEENGIENEDDFIGCSETLELKWNFTSKGQRELTITSREFVSHPESDFESTDDKTGDVQC